jgi:N-acetylglucosamine kinase-like BadF-type ATPase
MHIKSPDKAVIENSVAYYLGIDGGGSKTKCAIGDDTTTLASATAGPGNITRIGEARARESIHQAITQACAAAEISPQQITSACIGAAGAARQEIAEAVRRFAAELIPGKIKIVGDMEIALQAAFGAGPGIIVIAGTGSIAFGRNQQGQTARAGGWGYAISDEGSAHWIARQAVIAILRAADEAADKSANSPLLEELKRAWNVTSLEQLASESNATQDFAVLFPAVVLAADAPDEQAQQILKQAAAELFRLAQIVLKKLFPAENPPVPIAMVGGVFRHALKVRESFAAEVHAENSNVMLNREVIDPIQGALQLARKGESDFLCDLS